jgi:hypothetical protein
LILVLATDAFYFKIKFLKNTWLVGIRHYSKRTGQEEMGGTKGR